MIVPRRWAMVTAALVLLGVGLGLDALIVTDAERLEDFVADITGRIDAERVEHALRYVDPAAQPLELTVLDNTETWSGRDGEGLRARIRRAMEPFHGQTFRRLQQSIRVRGTSATVSLQVLSEQGLRSALFSLRRHGDRWLVERASIR